MDLRKVALVVLIALMVGAIQTVWNSLDRAFGLGVTGSNWFILPTMALGFLFTALMPAFYFAWYCDRGDMRFPRELRKLALAAAIAGVVVLAVRVRAFAGPWTWMTAIGPLSNVPYILLLFAMSRNIQEAPSEQSPPTDFLVAITKLTVVVWGAWVAFQLVRLAVVWATYSQMESLAFQVRRAPPALGTMMGDVLLTFFSQASLLAVPFIVWRSGFGRAQL